MLRAQMDPKSKRIVYRDDGMGGSASVSLPMISVGGDDPAPAAPARAPSMTMGGMAPPTMAGAQAQGAAAAMPVRSDPSTPLGTHLSGLEKQYGLPSGYLAQIRAIESSNGTNLANPNSSARGPYQIINSTRQALGLSPQDVMDEYKSSSAIAGMAAKDAAAFQRATGRAPTGADLYGMHQQGQAGYLGLLRGQTPSAAAQALNGAGGMDANGQLGVIQRMYQNARPDLPGDPTTRYGSGGGATLANNAGSINAVSPVATQGGVGGDSGGGTATPTPAATTPNPADQKYTGGILGLLQGGDYSGAGANKDFMGKMGDFTNSSAFSSGIKGLMGAIGGGSSAPAIKAPGIQNLPEEDQENKPQMSLLQMLYGKGGVMAGGVGGR